VPVPLRDPLRFADPHLGVVLAKVAALVRDAGGTAYLVGGCVRDHLLGGMVRDLDLEVFGLEADRLQRELAARYRLDLVGRAFGVLKLRGVPVDVGLPRRETKIGRGHRGFTVDSDPWLPLDVAARRRDFTLNAIYLDPLRDQLEDPVGGIADLERRILRHTSPAFAEDPLRVLRGMQLAARYEFAVDPVTVELCRRIQPEDLARERIYDEWRKLLLLGRRPSLGLAFVRETGWLRYYPELEALTRCPQDPVWHPEGDVWTHTLHALDAFADERIGDDREDLVVGLAVLCHDFGKPLTSVRAGGGTRVRSPRHESAGEEPTRAFLARLTDQRDLINEPRRPRSAASPGASGGSTGWCESPAPTRAAGRRAPTPVFPPAIGCSSTPARWRFRTGSRRRC
jgi:tRNA nucleotidyltransferase (CCA-adding enzyme)